MKKIRKYFNCPSKIEAKLLSEGCDKIKEMAKEYANKHNNDQYKYKNERDGICPRCKNTEIVNKISRVEGSEYVSGSFIFGSGGIYGSSKTDTNEVNHCNKCGNQWKKYDTNYKWDDDIIADWINNLNYVFEGKYDFGDKTVVLLKDIPAESIWKEANRIETKLYYSTKDNISLSFLRTKFKTIYQ